MNIKKFRKEYWINGKTTNDKKVFSGKILFHFRSTYGLPLDCLIDELWKYDYVISWFDFIDEAIISGWKDKKIIDEIEYGLRDAVIYKKEEIEYLLDKCFKYLEEKSNE